MPILFFNDKFLDETEIKINPFDRGFLLGDGLFETLRTYQQKPLFIDQHYQRLATSAQQLGIPLTITLEKFQNCCTELIKRNDMTCDAVIRLTLTRGKSARGLSISKNVEPTLLISVCELTELKQAVSVEISAIRRNEFSPLAQIKSINYLDNVLAKHAAHQNGFDEALLLNTQGFAAEACAANVFLVSHGKLYTPKISDGALPGIMRAVILNLCNRLKIATSECSLTLSDLSNAEEIFLTNSLIGVQAVTQLNERKIEKNTVTKKIKKSLVDHIQELHLSPCGRGRCAQHSG